MGVPEDQWPITRNQLRAGRLLAGLGIREFARETGHSTTAISQIERGSTPTPQLRTIENLWLGLRANNIEFAPGGWVRHRDDAAHGRDPRDAQIERRRRRSVVEHAFMLACLLIRTLHPDYLDPSMDIPLVDKNPTDET